MTASMESGDRIARASPDPDAQVRHYEWIFGPNYGMVDACLKDGARPDITRECVGMVGSMTLVESLELVMHYSPPSREAQGSSHGPKLLWFVVLLEFAITRDGPGDRIRAEFGKNWVVYGSKVWTLDSAFSRSS